MEKKTKRDWIKGACIGKGSFGTVSLAVDRNSSEIFAIKSISSSSSPPASVSSLENEIEILKSLDSPYIVSYIGDDVSADGCRNLHMEYIDGGTLADSCPMQEAYVRVFTRCVTRALQYLHDVAGVVHGDVKGRNVLVVPGSLTAKLADFGSATKLFEKKPGPVQGTPLWMAPEVIRGETQSPASDIWSLGCTVIEIATGKRPWEHSSRDAESVLFRIGYGGDTELPEFPAGFSKTGLDFLDKCLKRNSDERWTAEQLLQHPFLSEEENVVTDDDVARPSPRSVFDWASLEFDEEEDDELSTNHHEFPSSANRRIAELASSSSPSIVSWSDDDDSSWLTVREMVTENTAVTEESGIYSEYIITDCSGLEWEENSENSNIATTVVDGGMRFDSCSSCNDHNKNSYVNSDTTNFKLFFNSLREILMVYIYKLYEACLRQFVECCINWFIIGVGFQQLQYNLNCLILFGARSFFFLLVGKLLVMVLRHWQRIFL